MFGFGAAVASPDLCFAAGGGVEASRIAEGLDGVAGGGPAWLGRCALQSQMMGWVPLVVFGMSRAARTRR